MSENYWLNASTASAASTSTNETGILRTIKPYQKSLLPPSSSSLSSSLSSASSSSNDNNRFDDLLIFGYACKLFRDDDKARHIDQGKHLIPWMGDSTLKIDRYDVRAALTDISQYEAPAGGYDNRLDYLSSAEQRAEQLCEQERYFSLYNNDVEEELYKEEELKRLKPRVGSTAYGQVGFSYDQVLTAENNPTEGNVANDDDKLESDKDDPPDEIYVPHPKFFIPLNMHVPETTKVHAIIEKTAKFISTQGPQMEILIKAKQANNPLFEFLNQNSRLNPFYKHSLQAMKDGAYPEDGGKASTDDTPAENTTEIGPNTILYNYYSSIANQPKLHVPTIKYKPSADCAYTQLISKIKGVPINLTETDANDRVNTPSPVMGYSNSSDPLANTKNSQSQSNTKPFAAQQTKTDVEVKKISSGLMLAQYYNSDSDSDSENDDNIDDAPSKAQNRKGSDRLTQANEDQSQSSIASLASGAPLPDGILCPPEELRNIIDKTAAYVLKNGKEFEDILRSKNDERFTFLQYTDEFYKYYTYKVTGIVCPNPPSVAKSSPDANQSNLSTKLTNADKCSRYDRAPKKFEIAKAITPVSFSIKSKEETTTAISTKPALPLEHSSDEEDGVVVERKEPPTQHNYSTVKDLPLPANFQQANISLQSSAHFNKNNNNNHNQTVQNNGNGMNVQTATTTGEVEQSDSFIRDTILEQQHLEEKKELKRAEDKVKDRLAQLAREKLGIISKEKQLQLERRKKAMAFLNQMNGPSSQQQTTDPSNVNAQSQPKRSDAETYEVSTSSDSSDSVTFVMASPSTSIGAIAQSYTAGSQRNLRTTKAKHDNNGIDDSDEDDDDVIEIVSEKNSHSRSRSRSKSSSSKLYSSKHKSSSKHSKKKSSKRRSRSRSRSRSPRKRYSRSSSRDRKRKIRSSSKPKRKKHRYSDD